MKEFLDYLLKLIVEDKDTLSVEEITLENNSFQYNITAGSADLGKIIGRNGKIIQAIRQLAKILAVKKGIHVRIQIS